ncbi:MAG: hypothetical protein R2745_15880 [Vicinamibacterales bacterium]
MTPARFAKELAASLAASLPDGFGASADGDTVTIETPSGEAVTTALELESDDEGDPDVYVDAAESVLSLAQDVVCEALDVTWPGPPGGGGDLPIPGARMDGGVVCLWFGDEDAPVLRLADIGFPT